MCLTRNERNMFLFFLSDQCKDAKTWRKTIEWGRLAAAAKSLQSCLNLCDPIDGRAPGSSVPGILQARILEWVAIFFSSACIHAKPLQSCPTLCNTMDISTPGPSVHRILQARILEWVDISFSQGRLEISAIKSEIQKEHFMQRWAQ